MASPEHPFSPSRWVTPPRLPWQASIGAKARGRTIALGPRVLQTLAGDVAAGLAMAAWIQEGLLEFAVPNSYVDEQIDPDFPFEWLAELAQGTGCRVFRPCSARSGDRASLRGEPLGEELATAERYDAATTAAAGTRVRQVVPAADHPRLLRRRRYG